DQVSQLWIVSADLDCNHTLTAGRYKNFSRQHRRKKFTAFKFDSGPVRVETEPFQTRPRENDRVPTVSRELAQSRRHIASKIDNLEVRPFPTQLMFSSHASSRDNS